ncbi:VCBS repeat-containing protein [Streptomyces tanashiensis]|uniref:FG-GAP repeat domain-containing protein n=1 Tax=Streptomyces tanashiensis TaxID=67367 RepID=UPI0034065352
MRTAPPRRRATLSVGVVLAGLTAASLAVPTALAAPAPAAVTQRAGAVAGAVQVPFLASGGQLLGAGATGFLSRDPGGTYRWTRYEDGTSKVFPPDRYASLRGSGSDAVVLARQQSNRPTLESLQVYDMAAGTSSVTVRTADLRDPVHAFHAVAGSTMLMGMYDGSALKQLSVDGGTPSVRTVSGVASDVDTRWLPGGGLTDAALVTYPQSDGKWRVGVVDLAGAQVVDSYERDGAIDGFGYVERPQEFLTSKRVAWIERTEGRTVLASAVRGRSEVERTPLGPDDKAELSGGLLGDWFAFGASTGSVTPWHTFTARSLTDGTSVKLLDFATSVTKGPGDSLLVLGTTAAQGEGVYRVELGADGKPAARLIATTGEPNHGVDPVTYVGADVPAVVSLDRATRTRLEWTFSSSEADFSVMVRRKWGPGFGATVKAGVGSDGASVDASGRFRLDWSGEVLRSPGNEVMSAPPGEYEWTVSATPWNGMPSTTVTGTFTVTRTPQPHDYSDNGSPDLLARTTNGRLFPIDTRWDATAGRLVPLAPGESVDRGGWNDYDRVEAVGDVAGAEEGDLVSRDRDGVLWLHEGTGDSSRTFWARVRIGGGWNTYTEFTGGSDLTGDGRADLVAADKAGDLWLYRATGSTAAPFEARRKIAHGWGFYNQLTAVGNVAGAPAGDLVARDTAGVLWLYLGRGDGTFAPRTKIGGGWNAYADVVGIGDGNKDGRPDLYARTAAGAAYFYAGTGDWKVPFKARATTQAGAGKDSLGRVYHQVS